MTRGPNTHKLNALNSAPPANAWEAASHIAAEDGCRWLLRGMLSAGQHFWSFDDALTIARVIGLQKAVVRQGIGR